MTHCTHCDGGPFQGHALSCVSLEKPVGGSLASRGILPPGAYEELERKLAAAQIELSRARSSEAALREELREAVEWIPVKGGETFGKAVQRIVAERDSARAELAALVELLDESLHYTDCPEEWVERGEDWIVRANKALASVRATARREGGK